MEFQQLINDGELAARLAAGIKSRVIILGADGIHYEVNRVISLGEVIIVETGEEAVAPIDPVEQEADKIDAAMEAEYRRDDERAREEVGEQESDLARHLRMAEDQPAQERDL